MAINAYDEATSGMVVYVGSRLVVSGAGFEPGTEVEVWMFSDPMLLGTAIAASDGTWSLEVTIRDVEVGEHLVQVEGTAGGGAQRTVRGGLLVRDAIDELTLPVSGTDLALLEYSILLAALGTILALIATGTRRRPV